jgi:hypothetical protein
MDGRIAVPDREHEFAVIEMVRGSASSGGTFRREVEVDGDSTGSREVGYVARFTTDRVADR